jgi:hypothetical protein
MLFIFLACSPKPKYSCEADIKWITDSSLPSEIAKDESFCDFYQFSWQWFLAQGQEVTNERVNQERVFEQNRIYQVSGIKDQCSLPAIVGRTASFEHSEPRIRKSDDHEKAQADGHALYDQNGNILEYNIYYSPVNCQATEKGFPEKALEIKASWMMLDKYDEDYLVIAEGIGEGLQYYGLVGMHLAIWTPNHPEAIWATWEHKDNAPLCDGSSPIQEYNFASKAAAKCLHKHKSVDKCTEYKFNQPHDTNPIQDKSTPINVCREYAYGSEIKSVNGNDTKANIQAIQDLNDQLVGKKGMLTQLPKNDPMHVWSNYEMIGALWTKNGAASGKPPVPSMQGLPDASSLQRGSLELTNMTMETFQQGNSSFVPNCFGCHNYDPTSPLGVSHIQQNLK